MKLYTIEQLRLKALKYNAHPNNALQNLIGNNAIRAFLISIAEEEIEEIKAQQAAK